jgi:HEAT repeat protein
MAIRSSASQEVRRLVGDLSLEGPDGESRREAAVARLAVIGTRAVRQLLEALNSATSPVQRAAVLQALEAIPDHRAVEPVRALLGAATLDVRLAAARVSRALLGLPQGTALLDTMTAIAMDRAQPEALRAGVIDALATLPPRTVKPLWDRLKDDPSPAVRSLLTRAGAVIDDPVVDLEEAADGWLPRDPGVVLQLVSRASAEAPLSTLHRIVERVRTKEAEAKKGKKREWLSVRGAAHVALAKRNSRVALYDLREALEQATEPLPADFLEALRLVGDQTTLEPLAAAYVHSESMADGEAWRRSVADTFQSIVARERITRRSSAVKRVGTRFRDRVAALLSASSEEKADRGLRRLRR